MNRRLRAQTVAGAPPETTAGAGRPGASLVADGRRTVAATLVVLAVASGFYLLYRLAGITFDVFFALVLGTALRPGVDRLARLGFSRRVAGLAVSGTILTLLLLALLLLMPTLVKQGNDVTGQLPRYLEGSRRWLASSSSTTVRQFARDLPPLSTGSSVLGSDRVRGYLFTGVHGALNLIGIWLLGFYWLVDGERMTRVALLSVSEPRRERVREFIGEAESKVGGYVRGQVLVCLASATLSVVAYGLIGLPNALLLGILFGALAVLPVLGAPLGALPAVLIALATEPRRAFWVVVAAVVVHFMQDYVLAPRLVGRRVGVNAFTVMLAVTAFGSLIGLAGAVLAIPMAAIIQLLVDRFVFVEDDDPPSWPLARDHRGVLRVKASELATDARKQVREPGSKPDESFAGTFDLVESLAKDVEKRLAGADDPAGWPAP